MSDETLPVGPLPDNLESTVVEIMKEVGLNNLSMKTLRIRLEAKYRIDFRSSHKAEVDKIVERVMKSEDMQKELAKAQKQKDEESALPKKGKKTAKPGKGKEKKEKKEKEAKRPRTSAAKKPSDYPKAALSAYFIFAAEKRAELLQEDPTLKMTDIGKKVAALWNALTEEGKTKYKELADKDKARFESEMATYVANGGEKFARASKSEKPSKKKSRKEKDPNAPKRALSAYFVFANEQRAAITAANPTMKITEIASKIGDAWKALSEDEKKPYAAKAEEDKARYAKECAEKGITLKPSASKKKAAAASSSGSSSDSSSDSSDSSSSSDSDSSSDSSSSSSSDSD